jgi:4-amino-4-deoxy-L-arabinose transferase-like glycosyltransferase
VSMFRGSVAGHINGFSSEFRTKAHNQYSIVVSVILTQLFFWSLVPFFINISLPLDVVRDGLSIGREFQWGYYKHPPLASWCVELFFRLFGDYGPYLLSQICICSTIWLVFSLGTRLYDDYRAAAGAIFLTGIYYFSWPTPEFNHNVAEMPLWAAGTLLFHRCLNEGKARDWILLGLAAGLGMLVKYAFAVLLVVMALFILAVPKHRRLLFSRWPYVASAVMLTIVMPHLIWLGTHDFMPLQYLNERAKSVPGLLNRLGPPVHFLGAQLADHLPMLALVALSGIAHRRAGPVRPKTGRDDTIFLWMMGFGPAAVIVAMAIATGRAPRDMWGAPMWNLSGLIVANYLSPLSMPDACRRLRLYALAIIPAGALGYGAAGLVREHFVQRPARTGWPDRELAAALEARWLAATGCKLRIVAGDEWLASMAGTRAKDRPSVLIYGKRELSPWITENRLSAEGALVIWHAGDGAAAASKFAAPFAMAPEGIVELRWPRNSKAKPLRVAYAAMPPVARCASN